MNKVANFSKVSFKQFYESMFPGKYQEDRHENLSRVQGLFDAYENIHIPTRATIGSAGHDFRSPFDITLAPGDTATIPTGIRCEIDDGWALLILPRSGLGSKYRAQLDNTVGLIDSDYAYADNEGHIFVKLTNDSKEGKELRISAGQAFVQGVLIPYGITYNDDATGTRTGGFGSTDNTK